MGKDGKKKMEEMGVPQEPQGTLQDEIMGAADAAHDALQTPNAAAEEEQEGGAEGAKRKEKADKKEKKRKEKEAAASSSGAVAPSEGEASKQPKPKKQKVGKELVVAGGEGGEGGTAVVKSRRGKDENWDKRIEGQKFGEWR
jgi:hypothetical protein